jgi:hypothetical protein
MPRTGPRRSLTTAAALLAMLAAPAAAQAATYTVKPNDGPCGAADLACGTLAAAAAAAATGDVFNVSPGTYASATFPVGGVTITGTGADVVVNGVLTFSAAAGGVSKLGKLVVAPADTTGPAISVTGAAGLELSDAIVLGPNGHGVEFDEGTANKIVRSTIATGGQSTSAVRVFSADASSAAKAVTIESTMLIGGLAGLSVQTGVAGLLGSASGDVTATLRHVTAAGSTNSLLLDSSRATAPVLQPGVGNITVGVTDSILQKPTSKNPYEGLLTLLNKNTITDTYTRTLQQFDSAAVFQDPARNRYRLKAGSPAINAGGFTAGESTKDIDGDDRSAAPTDQGADEYVTPPPPPPPPPPAGPAGTGDGVAPKVVITKPKLNEKVRLTTKTTKTTTVTKNGKKVKVKKTTTKKNKIGFAGTATDPSGIGAVAITVQKLASGTDEPPATAAPTAKCKWLNGTKGIVSKACAKPILLLTKLAADGSWTYNLSSKLKLGAGTYRIIAVGVDKSGARGNSATTGEAIHRFTLLK